MPRVVLQRGQNRLTESPLLEIFQSQTQYVHTAMTTLDRVFTVRLVGSICHELYSRGCRVWLASTGFQRFVRLRRAVGHFHTLLRA